MSEQMDQDQFTRSETMRSSRRTTLVCQGEELLCEGLRLHPVRQDEPRRVLCKGGVAGWPEDTDLERICLHSIRHARMQRICPSVLLSPYLPSCSHSYPYLCVLDNLIYASDLLSCLSTYLITGLTCWSIYQLHPSFFCCVCTF